MSDHAADQHIPDEQFFEIGDIIDIDEDGPVYYEPGMVQEEDESS